MFRLFTIIEMRKRKDQQKNYCSILIFTPFKSIFIKNVLPFQKLETFTRVIFVATPSK